MGFHSAFKGLITEKHDYLRSPDQDLNPEELRYKKAHYSKPRPSFSDVIYQTAVKNTGIS